MAKKRKKSSGRSKGGRRMSGGKDDLVALGVGIAGAVVGKLIANKVPENYKKYAPAGLVVAGVPMTRMKNPMLKAAGTGLAIVGGQSLVGTLVPALAGGSLVRFNSQGRKMNGFSNVPTIGQAGGFPKPSSIGQGFPKPSALGNAAAMYAAGAFD